MLYYRVGSLLRKLGRDIFKAVRIFVFFLTDSVAFCFRYSDANTALIVRLDAIGDAAVWFQSGAGDIVAELRKSHTEVVLIVNSSWAELATALGIFDRVIPVTPRQFMRDVLYRIKILRRIRSLGARSIVQPRAAKVFLQEDSIVRMSGCTNRIGISGTPVNISPRILEFSNIFYTRIIDPDVAPIVHETIRNNAFASKFCAVRGQTISPDILHDADGVLAGQRFFAIAPGAGAAGRQWPIAKFAETCVALQHRFGLQCVILGAASDQALASELQHYDLEYLDLTGQLTLSQTTSLIARSELLISNESGLFHIGKWVKRPVLGIIGGGHFGWFVPYPGDTGLTDADICFERMPCYNCNWNCIYKVPAADPFPCVSAVSANAVIEKCAKILGKVQ